MDRVVVFYELSSKFDVELKKEVMLSQVETYPFIGQI